MSNNDELVKSNFKQRLIAALRDYDVPERGQGAWLAKKMEVTPKAASKWLNGESLPDQTKWPRLAALIGKHASYFYEGMDLGEAIVKAVSSQPERFSARDRTVEYQIDEHVCLPYYANGEPYLGLNFNKKWFKNRGINLSRVFVIQCNNPSMEPTISKGDIVIIDTGVTRLKDNKIYALKFGGEVLLKRIYLNYDGGVIVHSDSDSETDRLVPESDIEKLKIIGKVVWRGGSL